jgi:hypothetical protein
MGQQEGVQLKVLEWCSCSCPSPFPPSPPAGAQTGWPIATTQRGKLTVRRCCTEHLDGWPALALSRVWLISALAGLGAGCLSGLSGPVFAMGSSGFMLFCGQPAATPHLPAPSLVHSSNRGGVLFRLGRKLCVSVSQTPQRSWSSSFMGPGCRHHRRSLVTSVPCCMLDF